ncbi:hypothetical protein GCM10023194_36000 [Planotetraspora phitsanulokensis]|uniref:Uncharacterized protein n=1 Tax=Planotetraspora phitsanulokensis TaxID=575192 RepID=A0A8J3U1N2_9ACTN|nr:hypothetical protein [Planotetraspora phitsanulokensis]GII36272.1 hypothetical protein Pph01_12750 [Planotetraspora phitsanulokensis]
MNDFKCTQCGEIGLEPGFVEDAGQSSQGYLRWIEGALERGPFGGAKRLGRQRWQVDAYRCPRCAHLELFASSEI